MVSFEMRKQNTYKNSNKLTKTQIRISNSPDGRHDNQKNTGAHSRKIGDEWDVPGDEWTFRQGEGVRQAGAHRPKSEE